MNHMLYLPYDFHTTIISLTSSLLPGPCSQEGRTGAFSWRVISWFLILFSVKREVRKLFFLTRDLKVLRDPWRTWTFNRYSWFHHSILGDFEAASPTNGRTTVAKSHYGTTSWKIAVVIFAFWCPVWVISPMNITRNDHRDMHIAVTKSCLFSLFDQLLISNDLYWTRAREQQKCQALVSLQRNLNLRL